MTSSKLYTAKDVERCYPWISAGTINYRVKSGAIPLTHPSTGTGIPNMFTLPELVHCAVIDELASLGVFGNLHTVEVSYIEENRSGATWEVQGYPVVRKVWTGGENNPYFVDVNFYERQNYGVIVDVELVHRFQEDPGTWGRFYEVLYYQDDNLDMLRKLKSWLPGQRTIKIDWTPWTPATRALIRVRQLYDTAAETLNLPKE